MKANENTTQTQTYTLRYPDGGTSELQREQGIKIDLATALRGCPATWTSRVDLPSRASQGAGVAPSPRPPWGEMSGETFGLFVIAGDVIVLLLAAVLLALGVR